MFFWKIIFKLKFWFQISWFMFLYSWKYSSNLIYTKTKRFFRCSQTFSLLYYFTLKHLSKNIFIYFFLIDNLFFILFRYLLSSSIDVRIQNLLNVTTYSKQILDVINLISFYIPFHFFFLFTIYFVLCHFRGKKNKTR